MMRNANFIDQSFVAEQMVESFSENQNNAEIINDSISNITENDEDKNSIDKIINSKIQKDENKINSKAT